jgi:hypothetical protein
MNYVVLVPLLVPLTVAIVVPVLASIGKRTMEDVEEDVFRYSIGLRIFIWFGAILFSIMPFVFWIFGVRPKILDSTINSLIVIFLIFCGLYLRKYSVALGECQLSVGAFWRRNVMYKDIRSAETQTSGRGGAFLIVKYGDAKRISISASLQDFQDLVQKLNQKIKR